MRIPHTLLALGLCSAGALSEPTGPAHHAGCIDEAIKAAAYMGEYIHAYKQCLIDHGVKIPEPSGNLARSDDAHKELDTTPYKCIDSCGNMMHSHSGHSLSPWAGKCRTCMQDLNNFLPGSSSTDYDSASNDLDSRDTADSGGSPPTCQRLCSSFLTAKTDQKFQDTFESCIACMDGGIAARTDHAHAENAYAPTACYGVCVKMEIPHPDNSVSPWAGECRTCVQASDSTAPYRIEVCRSTCNDIYTAASDQAFEDATKACGQCEIRNVYARDAHDSNPLLPGSCIEPCEAMIDNLDDDDSTHFAEQCRSCLIGTGPESDDLDARDPANRAKICGKYCNDNKLKTPAGRKDCDRCLKNPHSYNSLPPHVDERDTDGKPPKHDDPCWRSCTPKKLERKHGQKHCDDCHALLRNSKTHLDEREVDGKHPKHHDPCLFVCTKRKLKTKLGRKVCNDCYKDPSKYTDNLPPDHENPVEARDADDSSKTPAACIDPCDYHTVFTPALRKACANCKKDPAAYARKHGPHGRDAAVPRVSDVCVTPCRNVFEANTVELLRMTLEICDACTRNPRKFRYDLDHSIDPAPTSLEAREVGEDLHVVVPEQCEDACTPSGHTAEEILEPLVDKCIPCVEQYGGTGNDSGLDERDVSDTDLVDTIPNVCIEPCHGIFHPDSADDLVSSLNHCSVCSKQPDMYQYDVVHGIDPLKGKVQARQIVEPATMPKVCRGTCSGVPRGTLGEMIGDCKRCLIDEGVLDDESLDVDGKRIFGGAADDSEIVETVTSSTVFGATSTPPIPSHSAIVKSYHTWTKPSHIKSSKKHHTKHSKDNHVSILEPVTTAKHVFPTSVLDCPGGLAENCIMGESTFTVSELPTMSSVGASVWTSVGKDKKHHMHKTQKDGDPYTKAKRQESSISTSSVSPTRTETITVVDSDPDQRTLNTPTTTGPDVFLSTLTLYPDGVDASGNTAFAATPSAVAVDTVTKILPPEVTSSSTSRGSGTATWNIPWFTGAHFEYVTITGPQGQVSTLTRADLGSTHITVSEITKTDGKVVLVSERPFTWATSPVDVATTVSWVPIATSTPASTSEPVDVTTSTQLVAPPVTTTERVTETVVSASPTTIYEAEDWTTETVFSYSASEPDVFHTLTVTQQVANTVTVYSEPDVTDIMTVTQQVPVSSLPDSVDVDVQLRKEYNAFMSSITRQNPGFSSWMAAVLPTPVPSVPSRTVAPFQMKDRASHLPHCDRDELVFNAGYLGESQPILGQVMWPWPFPPFQEWMQPDVLPPNASRPTSTTSLWPALFGGGEGYRAPYTTDLDVCSDKPMQTVYSTVFDAPMSGASWDYDKTATTTVQKRPAFTQALLGHTLVFGSSVAFAPRFDRTKTVTVVSADYTVYPLTKSKGKYGTHSYSIRPPYDATKTVTGFMDKDRHFHLPHGPTHVIKGTKMSHLAQPQCTKVIEVMGLGICGGTAYDIHFNTITRLPIPTTTRPCDTNIIHRLRNQKCAKDNCMWSYTRPLNYTTVANMMIPDPFEEGNYVWQNATFTTSQTRPHWGISDSKGVNWPFTLSSSWNEKKSTFAVYPEYLFAPGVSQTSRMALARAPKCWDNDTCEEMCADTSRFDARMLFALCIAIPILAVALLGATCCICMPRLRRKRQEQDEKHNAANQTVVTTHDPATGAATSTLVTAAVVGGAAGAAGSGHGGGNQSSTTAGGAAGSGGSGVGAGTAAAAGAGAGAGAAAAAAGGDGRGTQRRAAEEGRQPKGVRFDEKSGAATGGATGGGATGGGSTTTAAAPPHGGPGHVDGVAERSGSEVFDVGSMRGRKRNRGEEGLGVGLGTGMEDARF